MASVQSLILNPPVVHGVGGRVLHGCRVLGLPVHARWGAHGAHLGRHVAHVRGHVRGHVGSHVRPHVWTHTWAIRTSPHLVRGHSSWGHAPVRGSAALSCHRVNGAHAWSRVVGIGHVAITRLPGVT